ncbi:origin recognition complex subunit 2-domain-containing protein [Leucosporidium creatinivorum]|uniref:Origin recognition complex subunit 2 n=1 Tax=Leucosporidium creatinivorum TaxID=106004 RepID=A0A1Y2FQ93_9BASI|nr:origin recognition complex subunit 2-domain-containing protein [Leucosporidium creatinivorum]
MAPPPAKRARLHTGTSSPPKPSSSPVKGSARRPLGSQLALPPSPLKRASLPSSSTAQPAQDGSQDSEDEGVDPLAHPVRHHQRPPQHLDASNSNSFITSSTGDAYLLASASPSKTSDNLFSSSLPNGPFTLQSYHQALTTYDSNPSLQSQRQALHLNATTYDAKYFNKWCWELDQGFNILLHGFGSKRDLLNRFAEQARKKGEVVVVNGFDTQCSLGDVVATLEEIVKAWEREDEMKKGPSRASPRKGGATPKKGASPRKGKGKATTTNDEDDTPTASRSLPVLPPSLSALESRIRRLLHSLTPHQSPPSPRPPIYLLLHSLDGPTLRLPKTLSLLALLAAQPGIQVVASVDHLRAAMLFQSSLLNTRPEGLMRPYRPNTKLGGGGGGGGGGEGSEEGTPAPRMEKEEQEEAEEAATTNLHLRTFTFLPYHVPTLTPYTHETSHASTLSTLLPSSIFPSLTTTIDRSAESLKQSVGHVLDSVTERAKRVFEALARMQVEDCDEGDGWRGLRAAQGQPAPGCAVSLEVFKNHCTDRLLAAHNDQVDALLSEFRDHGVVRGSLVAPARQAGEEEEEEEGEGGGEEWVWVPLERTVLGEVLEEMGSV